MKVLVISEFLYPSLISSEIILNHGIT